MAKFSTDNVELIKFRPHGRIEITIYSDGIIKYIATGPFNSELIEALSITESDALPEFKSKFGTWCELVVFKDSALIFDDAIKSLEQYLKETKQRNSAALACAFVFEPKLEGGRLMEPRYEECYKSAGIPYKSFGNEEDALKWVKAQLNDA